MTRSLHRRLSTLESRSLLEGRPGSVVTEARRDGVVVLYEAGHEPQLNEEQRRATNRGATLILIPHNGRDQPPGNLTSASTAAGASQ